MNKAVIFLVGFMGVGKSAVGRRVASMLKYSFLDTDKMVEDSLSKKVSQIFCHEGEDFFRQAERAALEEVLSKAPVVISTGGGAPCYKDNLKLMKSWGTTVTLLATPETIFSRVAQSPNERPLLKCGDPLKEIRTLLQMRAYYYINSDFLVDTESRNVEQVAQEILKILSVR